jgi:hypothetical protein
MVRLADAVPGARRWHPRPSPGHSSTPRVLHWASRFECLHCIHAAA